MHQTEKQKKDWGRGKSRMLLSWRFCHLEPWAQEVSVFHLTHNWCSPSAPDRNFLIDPYSAWRFPQLEEAAGYLSRCLSWCCVVSEKSFIPPGFISPTGSSRVSCFSCSFLLVHTVWVARGVLAGNCKDCTHFVGERRSTSEVSGLYLTWPSTPAKFLSFPLKHTFC